MITSKQPVREQFSFSEEYSDFFSALSDKETAELLCAMCEYAFYGKDKKSFSNPILVPVWKTIKRSMEKDFKKAVGTVQRKRKKSQTEAVCESTQGTADGVQSTPSLYEPLADYHVQNDCSAEGLDGEALQKEFKKSRFLRETFKFTSKIQRHYEKILLGCYRDIPFGAYGGAKDLSDFQSAYTDEEIKSVLVDFSEE